MDGGLKKRMSDFKEKSNLLLTRLSLAYTAKGTSQTARIYILAETANGQF